MKLDILDELMGRTQREPDIVLDDEKTLKELIRMAEDEPVKDKVRRAVVEGAQATVPQSVSFSSMDDLRAHQKLQGMLSRSRQHREEAAKHRKPKVGDWLQATKESIRP